MEQKLVRYVMNLILAVGGKIKWTMKITLCMMPLKNARYKICIRISEPTNDTQDIVKGNNIVYLSENG